MLSNTIRIIGIDPGNHLGISILYIDPTTYNIISIQTMNITLERYSDNRLIFLQQLITDLYYMYRPNIVAFETSFLNMRYPKAVIQLSQYISIIETTLLTIDPSLILKRYPPKYVKAIVSGTGTSDKDGMSQAVTKIKELAQHISVTTSTEHEIDATCIAYTALQEVREFFYLLLALP